MLHKHLAIFAQFIWLLIAFLQDHKLGQVQTKNEKVWMVLLKERKDCPFEIKLFDTKDGSKLGFIFCYISTDEHFFKEPQKIFMAPECLMMVTYMNTITTYNKIGNPTTVLLERHLVQWEKE